jgi:murein DD-endopeptidase MepM/ murein hydrolase activator NlpD
MPVNILPTLRGPSAFLFRDAEGAPDTDGRKYHAAVDWFAPGETEVVAPCTGVVREARPSRGNSGQVFGGTCKIEDASGRLYVMRHVDPRVGMGSRVTEGQQVAVVTPWRDGSSHVHLEVWKSFVGGYRLPNMLDPGTLDWVATAAELEPPPPPPDSATLRLTLDPVSSDRRDWAGWEECSGPLRWIAAHGLDPRAKAALAWRGRVFRGPKNVTNVARHLVLEFLAVDEDDSDP